MAQLLRSGPFSNSTFVFREVGCPPQQFPIHSSILDEMVESRLFRMPLFRIRVANANATVFAGLRLCTDYVYPVSGLPTSVDSHENRKYQ